MNPAIARRRHAKAFQHQQENQNRREDGGQTREINVSKVERQLSMIGGTVLAGYGLLSRSITGLALAAIGGALIWRGHTGHCYCYEMLGHNSADNSNPS